LGWDDIQYSDRLRNTYARIVTSRPVLEELTRNLRSGRSARQIEEQIKIEIPANTELLQITVQDSDPAFASRAANLLAEILIREVIRPDAVSVIEPAIEPLAPSAPRKALNIALGSLVGLVGGVGLAFLFENLDTKLYRTKQIEDVTDLATLGKIPTVSRSQRRAGPFNSNSPQGEAYRRLRTNIFTLGQEAPLQTLVVTSAEPHEGKSTIVGGLASVIAQSGRKVLAVDADLRRPTLHKVFGLSNQVGLSNVLRQGVPLQKAVQATDSPGVQVLTSGPLPPNPAELLGEPRTAELIERLARQHDMVLLDTPSLLAVTDAAVLAPAVDGVVLVVRRAQTRQEAVRAAQRHLTNVKARIVGIVVNRAEADGDYHYYDRW
jgi:non-specific protein-tyrosine kinase